MPDALVIPADLTLLMRREALCDYSQACGGAGRAAEQCIASGNPAAALDELRACREQVIAQEEVLRVMGDDVATASEEWDLSLDDPNRDLISTRIATALDRVSRGLESSEEEILDAADKIERLRALLDALG